MNAPSIIQSADARDRSGPLVEEAAELLRSGALLVLPTDTGYALSGRVGDPSVIERVYASKARDPGKPLHMIVSGIEMAARYVELEPRVVEWMRRLLPGPLTLVLPALDTAPGGLNRVGHTLGIRIPDLPFTCAVVEALGEPITATSANPSGGAAPFSSEDLPACAALPGVRRIVDVGGTPYRRPSTIVEILPGSPPRLLRPGPIGLDRFEASKNEDVGAK